MNSYGIEITAYCPLCKKNKNHWITENGLISCCGCGIIRNTELEEKLSKERAMHSAFTKAFTKAMTKSFAIVERDDLYFLTKAAYEHHEITQSKAAELLGVPVGDMRYLAAGWRRDERGIESEEG